MEERATKPIRRRKLSDEVLDRVLAQIRSGQYRGGEQLPPERELMREYEVGRPAVREALQGLAAMGIITITHGERARVAQVTARSMISQIDRTARYLLSESADNIDYLKEARVFLETGLTRLAAEKATAEDIGALEACIEEMTKTRDTPAFIDADMAFHNTIAGISGNPIFAAVTRGMLDWLKDYHIDVVHFRAGEDVSISEHRQILGRIAAHDVEGAVQEMRNHLTRASDLYRARAGQS